MWEGFGTSRGPQKPIQEIGAVKPAVKSRGHTLLLVGDKDAGEPQKSNSDARKKSKFEEEAEENATEPFGGKTQTESENYPEEVQCKRGRRQSRKHSAGKNRSKTRERNAPGTRAERSVEDWHRTLRKSGTIPEN